MDSPARSRANTKPKARNQDTPSPPEHTAPPVQRGKARVPRNPLWSKSEDELMLSLVAQHGHKWTLISSHFPGRSDNAVKNRYHAYMQAHPEVAAQRPASAPRPHVHSTPPTTTATRKRRDLAPDDDDDDDGASSLSEGLDESCLEVHQPLELVVANPTKRKPQPDHLPQQNHNQSKQSSTQPTKRMRTSRSLSEESLPVDESSPPLQSQQRRDHQQAQQQPRRGQQGAEPRATPQPQLKPTRQQPPPAQEVVPGYSELLVALRAMGAELPSDQDNLAWIRTVFE